MLQILLILAFVGAALILPVMALYWTVCDLLARR